MLPPEINSVRMYAGPGSGPMIAAATAWDELAAELQAGAASYSSVISGLTAGWQGPSSAAMAAAAAPYVTWMRTTAAQSEQTANQARAAAAAYETAFAATVPPPVIAANRSLLMSLIATNLLGQNTPAIAATEANYAEMWAQDAAAMYGYAGSSASASQLTPFEAPPQTTSPAAAQAATVAPATGASTQTLPQLMAAVPQSLQSLAAPVSSAAPAAAAAAPAADPLFTPPELLATGLTSFFNGTIGPLSPIKLYNPLGSFYDLGVQSFLAPFNNFNMQQAYGAALGNAAPALGVGAPQLSVVSSPAPAVSAQLGNAGSVGELSVPQGWAGAAPAIRTVAAVLPQNTLGAVPAAAVADGQGSIFSNMALSGAAGRAVAGSGGSVGRTIGGAAVPGAATTATIIVIPED